MATNSEMSSRSFIDLVTKEAETLDRLSGGDRNALLAHLKLAIRATPEEM